MAGCTAGSGADTIVLPPGSTHTLFSRVPDTSLGFSGLPIVTSPITIEGNGSTVRRESGVSDFRIFTVERPGQLTLRSTTVSGGKLQMFGGFTFLYDGAVEGSVPLGPPPSGGCTVNGVPNQMCLGTPGPDTITGTSDPDVILGLRGKDTIRGLGGNDHLDGGPGRDRLIGGRGNDRLQGDAGNDTLVGGPGRDRLNGGKGRDRCKRDAADVRAASCE